MSLHQRCDVALVLLHQGMDLQRDGFGHAQTVSEFLTKENMERGAVVILDEAGQLAGKQMQALFAHHTRCARFRSPFARTRTRAAKAHR